MIFFTTGVVLYQVKMLMFYNVRMTSLIFIGKSVDLQYAVKVLCVSE